MREFAASPAIVLEKNVDSPVAFETASSRISGMSLNPLSSRVLESTDRVAAHGSKLITLPEGPTLRNADIVKIPKCAPMSIKVAPGLQYARRKSKVGCS